MGESMALAALAELKHQRMRDCADLQKRSEWRPPYALTTALELESIEMPRLPAGCARLKHRIMVAVPHANRKYRVDGVAAVVWRFPLDTVLVDRRFPCVSPACTWAMFAAYLDLEELIVLADSMMRRDRRLRRVTMEELIAYLDGARSYAQSMAEEGGSGRLFRGYANCRRALRLARSGTDSSMETRTRLVMPRYGLDTPQVNYPVSVKGRPIYLDLAYPEFKICIEYEGAHHAGQWLNDVTRRQLIEDAGWRYVQVTKLDIGNEDDEERLAERVARHIREVTGKAVRLTRRKTIMQVCDARSMRRKPLYERLGFRPLMSDSPDSPADSAYGGGADELEAIA
ncbi:hypothetical protein [Bifidobacterium parmae]|uniref:DUF559 domain-containing protein n=1 Tax=Bifidobacterium parmae TaxID=361854 RepID=A0A2N5J4W6_9BIFI|nr:hypothetical protein [Bifidobacterium parmae]PLS29260.1 hypothetical protein Uis4E_0680 [Bifidobacterium parmae]